MFWYPQLFQYSNKVLGSLVLFFRMTKNCDGLWKQDIAAVPGERRTSKSSFPGSTLGDPALPGPASTVSATTKMVEKKKAERFMFFNGRVAD